MSGDCNNQIYLWEPRESSWAVNQTPFVGHEASVEDVQWSPTEDTVGLNPLRDKFLMVSIGRSLSHARPTKQCGYGTLEIIINQCLVWKLTMKMSTWFHGTGVN